MNHSLLLRIVALMLAIVALVISNMAWLYSRRMRRYVEAALKLNKQVILDAWRGGLEQAATTVDVLVRNGADANTVQAAIQELIREVKEERAKV